jgi:outer membrane protein assembly factor BamB
MPACPLPPPPTPRGGEPPQPLATAAPLTGPRLLWTFPLHSLSFGAAAVADVNADGCNDVAFGTYFGDASVHVLSGKDGHQLWAYHDKDPNRDDCYDASCRFADLHGDGHLELIVPCSSGCKVLCFDAADGRVLWDTDVGLKNGECIDTPPAIVDADGDGKPDITVGTFKGRYHVLHTDGAIARTLKVAPGAVQSCPLVMDLNGDGVPDFVAGNFKGDNALHAVSGKDGRELWKVATDPKPGKVSGDIYHGPSLGRIYTDMGSDGLTQQAAPRTVLTFAAYDGHVRAVDPASGAVLWDATPGDRYFMSPTAMADLGGGDVVTFAACEWITAINGNGTIRWHVPVREGGGYDSVTRGVAIADLNGDGVPDVAYLTSRGLFRVLDSRDGHMIYEYDAGTSADGHKAGEGSHGPVIADLNGDGHLDVFFVVGGFYPSPDQKDAQGKPVQARWGEAICLTGFPGKASPTNCWPMMRHDAQNTGNAGTPLEPGLLRHMH